MYGTKFLDPVISDKKFRIQVKMQQILQMKKIRKIIRPSFYYHMKLKVRLDVDSLSQKFVGTYLRVQDSLLLFKRLAR